MINKESIRSLPQIQAEFFGFVVSTWTPSNFCWELWPPGCRLILNFNSVPHPLTGSLAVSVIYQLFVVRIRLSLRICYLEFDKETIFDGCRIETSGIGARGFWIISDFRELSSVVIVVYVLITSYWWPEGTNKLC